MKRNIIVMLGLAAALSVSVPATVMADNSIAVENCGAYLFEWRPVDCGNGQAFAILVGGNTINERDVILNRGYDYGYSLYPSMYSRTWGEVPALVNIDGVWGIPENWGILPEGSQPTNRITLITNNKNMASNERYVDVVYLPNSVNRSELPSEVRKYLINVDGSDAGAYKDTETPGWFDDEETKNQRYRQLDGSFITNTWIKSDGKSYYFDENGFLLKDAIAPDGSYVDVNGEKQSYIPGWTEVDGQKKYIQKNGYYAANTWITDTDGKSYYFNMAAKLLTDTNTPDGYHVGADGAWDGQPSTINNAVNPGPGGSVTTASEGWEESGENWKYRMTDGSYVTNAWKQTADGKWYYFDESSLMMKDAVTPDGHYVDADGVWVENTNASSEGSLNEGSADTQSGE